ncbi:MAG TPA: DUF6152 family protein [Terriglobia bacterium]|nr:DUF6152 family protein [Terriglobia bacterium]
MKRILHVALLCGLTLTGAGIPAWAHHSFAAAYDMSKQITIQGTIVEVRLTNPHSHFFLDVKNPETGKTERWSFEAGTPSGMIRNGYNKNEIKAGTVVTIKGYHARDLTQNAGMLQQLIMPDGKTYGMFGPQEGAAGR